jgi:hypothetical protein
MPKNKDPFTFIDSKQNVYRSVNVVVMFFDVIGFTKNTTNDEIPHCP